MRVEIIVTAALLLVVLDCSASGGVAAQPIVKGAAPIHMRAPINQLFMYN